MIRFERDGLVCVVSDLAVITAFEDSGPALRSVVYDRPGSDGVDVEPPSVGSRVITIGTEFQGDVGLSRSEQWRMLSPFLGRQPFTLVVDLEGGDGVEREIVVMRRDRTRSTPSSFIFTSTLSFDSLEPYWRTGIDRTVEWDPSAADETGFGFPFGFPFGFGSEVSGAGTHELTTGGTAPSPWVARLYGPRVGVSLRNDTNGGRLDFPGLVVPAGSWLELDFDQQTARQNGSPVANRLHRLDFATAEWAPLEPGVNGMRDVAEVLGDGAYTTVTWQDHDE